MHAQCIILCTHFFLPVHRIRFYSKIKYKHKTDYWNRTYIRNKQDVDFFLQLTDSRAAVCRFELCIYYKNHARSFHKVSIKRSKLKNKNNKSELKP